MYEEQTHYLGLIIDWCTVVESMPYYKASCNTMKAQSLGWLLGTGQQRTVCSIIDQYYYPVLLTSWLLLMWIWLLYRYEYPKTCAHSVCVSVVLSSVKLCAASTHSECPLDTWCIINSILLLSKQMSEHTPWPRVNAHPDPPLSRIWLRTRYSQSAP